MSREFGDNLKNGWFSVRVATEEPELLISHECRVYDNIADDDATILVENSRGAFTINQYSDFFTRMRLNHKDCHYLINY